MVTALALAAAAVVPTRAHIGTFADPETFNARAVESAPSDPYVQLNAGRAELIAYQETLDLPRLMHAYRHLLLSLTAGSNHGKYQVEDDPSLPLKERVARLERMMLARAAERRPDPTVFWTAYDRLEANLGAVSAERAPLHVEHVVAGRLRRAARDRRAARPHLRGRSAGVDREGAGAPEAR